MRDRQGTLNPGVAFARSASTARLGVPMRDYPKPIKKLIREYVGRAHENELRRALGKLDQSFAEWRAGKIDSWELSDRVHRYEMDSSGELYKKYHYGQNDVNLAYAIVAGILNRDEVPIELLEALEQPLSYYQKLKERGDLELPE